MQTSLSLPTFVLDDDGVPGESVHGSYSCYVVCILPTMFSGIHIVLGAGQYQYKEE